MKCIFAVALGFALAASLSAAQAATGDAMYAHPGRLVNAGPTKLNFYCTGSGTPTVVFDAGWQDWSPSWVLIQPVISRYTRTCTRREVAGRAPALVRRSTAGHSHRPESPLRQRQDSTRPPQEAPGIRACSCAHPGSVSVAFDPCQAGSRARQRTLHPTRPAAGRDRRDPRRAAEARQPLPVKLRWRAPIWLTGW
jgi:hypothetical protein